MLREAKNVHVAQTRALLVRRYTVFVGKKQLDVLFMPAAIEAMQAAQQHDPVPFMRYDGRQYWWFADAFWSEDEGLHAEDVRALVLERLRRKNRQLENARLSLSIETAERTGLARAPMSLVRRPRGPEAMVPGDVYELRSLAEPDSVALIVVDETQFLEFERCGASDPTMICSEPTVWYYRGEFFTSTSPVQARDVALFASQRTPEATRRPAISEAVQRAVYERDGGACVKCGSRFNLQYDHIIPFSRGGASAVENLQLLCSSCNRAKSAGFG